MNPLIRFILFAVAVAVLTASAVFDHLKVATTRKMLSMTESNLVQTTSSLNQCSDAREGDQALTQRAISAAQDCQRILHEQMQAKVECTPLDQSIINAARMAESYQTNASFLVYTNRADLVHLSRNGQTILTVDPNFNVLVHGVKIGRITETNWMPEP